MTKELVIGYIGNGKSANRYHIPFVLQRKGKIRIKKIFTFDHTKDRWADVEGVTYCEDLDMLLQDEELQVIVLSTPPSSHYELAMKVLSSNKHCVVEKPFTETVEKAKELFDFAQSKNLIIQCYQNRRFDSDFLTAQKVIESGKLGDVLEVEMHYDYYRPEVPKSRTSFERLRSYVYGHGCHTIDQVVSYFGIPDSVHYDTKQLLGEGRMNDYFDFDFHYGIMKVSVKSSYFRVKERPSFIVYGTNGMFVKQKKDRQEEFLKNFILPGSEGFGVDTPEFYGTLIYYDQGVYHEEKVISEVGDYGRYYDALYETIINQKAPLVKKEQTMFVMKCLEESIENLK